MRLQTFCFWKVKQWTLVIHLSYLVKSILLCFGLVCVPKMKEGWIRCRLIHDRSYNRYSKKHGEKTTKNKHPTRLLLSFVGSLACSFVATNKLGMNSFCPCRPCLLFFHAFSFLPSFLLPKGSFTFFFIQLKSNLL